ADAVEAVAGMQRDAAVQERRHAHARALQARLADTVAATISSAEKPMRPLPAHSLQPGRIRFFHP
ncbi:hypothetical protein AB2C49_33685, partial [Pseudomonas aeruginosa]